MTRRLRTNESGYYPNYNRFSALAVALYRALTLYRTPWQKGYMEGRSRKDMAEKNPEIRIPVDSESAVALVEEDMDEDEELDERKRNLIRAQKRLIE